MSHRERRESGRSTEAVMSIAASTSVPSSSSVSSVWVKNRSGSVMAIHPFCRDVERLARERGYYRTGKLERWVPPPQFVGPCGTAPARPLVRVHDHRLVSAFIRRRAQCVGSACMTVSDTLAPRRSVARGLSFALQHGASDRRGEVRVLTKSRHRLRAARPPGSGDPVPSTARSAIGAVRLGR